MAPNVSRWKTLDRILGFDRHSNDGHRSESRQNWLHEEERALLPRHDNANITSPIAPVDVTKVCLRLRHLVEQCVPCEMEESEITKAHSRIITPQVVQAAKEAGGSENSGCVVYSLLVNMRWFKHEATVKLWDADLHAIRATACGVIAKAIIESEEDMHHLLHVVLLRRYSFKADGMDTAPVNVIEKAVDLHAISVITSSGYQRCINYLWRGWLVQDEDDPSVFIDYEDKDNTNYWVHLDPDRIRAPMYQNTSQILFSIIYLVLYTAVINSVNPTGQLDAAEILMYLFTLGFVCDELLKFYKAGSQIFGFWNAFNGTLYCFLTVSLILRIIGLTHPQDSDSREDFNRQSYNMLAFIAPMFWSRLLLYLDSFKFFGAMLVVLKVMMKESVIFFALLLIMIVGFLQAFIGLDLADDLVAGDVYFIIESMAKSILQAPEFDGFETFGHPWGLILYYCFTFIIMIILLNILIALYNSAYEDIYTNADDEYLALFAQKTMQFVRAPDENVYVAPLNLVEIVISGLFEWWMPKRTYEFLNDCVMSALYSPLLFVAAYFDVRKAQEIRRNRARGEDDDDVIEEWEQMENEVDLEAEGWTKKCDAVKSNVQDDPAVVEVKKLREEVQELKDMLAQFSKTVGSHTAVASTREVTEQGESKKPETDKQESRDGDEAEGSS